jgi:hypothetical protein
VQVDDELTNAKLSDERRPELLDELVQLDNAFVETPRVPLESEQQPSGCHRHREAAE